MPAITLSDDEKRKLEALSQLAPELEKHRARLILSYAEGKPTLQAASQAGISRGRARYWKRQFHARRMGIFTIRPAIEANIHEVFQRLYATPDNLVGSEPSVVADKVNGTAQTEIPYPTPLSAIGINVDDSLAEAGKKVWLYHFALMLSHEQGTLLGEDIEELHDMRVATRRIRTAFDVFGPAFDDKIIKQYLKGLRKTGRVLGQVRDMDIILGHALDYQKGLGEAARSGLEPLLENWKGLVEKKRSRLVKHLESDAYERFKQSFNEFLQTPVNDTGAGSPGNESTNRLRDVVPVLLYSRYATVRAYDSFLPTATIRQLHALRIDFKQFRYTLEYFREILGESTGKAISEIKQYQDHLGELHDADVGCHLVEDFLNKLGDNQLQQPILERINPESIVAYLAFLYAERYRLMVAFPQMWQKFSRPEFRHAIAQAIAPL